MSSDTAWKQVVEESEEATQALCDKLYKGKLMTTSVSMFRNIREYFWVNMLNRKIAIIKILWYKNYSRQFKNIKSLDIFIDSNCFTL